MRGLLSTAPMLQLLLGGGRMVSALSTPASSSMTTFSISSHPRMLQDMLMNSRGIEYPDFRYTPWDMLDAETQNVAETKLAYTKTNWDLPGTADVEGLSWASLDSNSQRVGGALLGFNRETWDCWQNHYGDYPWTKLAEEGVQSYFEVLGWTEASWNGLADSPDTDGMPWLELTDEQQVAAAEVCFFNYTWEEKVSMPEWDQFVVEPTASPAPSSSPPPSSMPTSTVAPTVSVDPVVPSMMPSFYQTETLAPTVLIEYPEFRYKPWQLLDEETKALASEKLGYKLGSWNIPGRAEVELLAWLSLEVDQRVGAADLGFDEETWDCYQNHYLDYAWTDLVAYEIDEYMLVLGWNEKSWNGLEGPPPSENTTWAELTDEEQEAADALCYFNYTWDGAIPIGQWDEWKEYVTTSGGSTRYNTFGFITGAVTLMVGTMFFVQ